MGSSNEQVKAAREQVQQYFGCGITAAQDWCANALHTSRRAFQQWETGDRQMHPAFWELLSIKISMLNAHK
jgi:DNA-binding transcriptional regulator YiaG